MATTPNSKDFANDPLKMDRKTIVMRPTVDFSIRAKSAGRIKETTNKVFADKVEAIRAFEFERDTREDLMYLTSAEALLKTPEKSSPTFHGVKHGDKITDQDVEIPNVSYGIFPVADQAFFPKRSSKSPGWKIGMRDHFTSNRTDKSDHLFSQRVGTTSDESVIGSHQPFQQHHHQQQATLSSLPEIRTPTSRPSTAHSLQRSNTSTALGSSRPSTADTSASTNSDHSNTRPKTAAARRASMIELNKQKRLKDMHSEQQRKKSQYGLRDLPTPAPAIAQKYFGRAAQKSFYTTYSQLKARGEVLLGGYEELCDVILDEPEYNPFMQSVAQLEDAGVLNDEFGARMKLTASHLNQNNSQFATPVKGLSPVVTQRKAITEAVAAAKERSKTVKRVQHGEAENNNYISDPDNNDDDQDQYDRDPPSSEGLDVFFERSSRRSPTKSVNSEGLNILVFDDNNTNELPSESGGGYDGQSRKVWSPTSDSVWDCNQSGDPDDSIPPTPVSVTRLKLNDTTYQDTSLDTSYNVASPRAIFLSGCLRHNIPPVTTAVIRKKLSPVINLAHMLLGNKLAMILAPSLIAMPYLQVLNLCDNNLQDSGLAAIIDAISHHDDLAILDISQNVIGSEAAQALAAFVGNDQCKLKCLRMSDANIDDGECASFVEVLMNNVNLVELDMSKNLLGKDENLNAVQPDFVTGGESLAELLKSETCPIQILNLHWNMIRLEGAEVLCGSLYTNKVLTHLDLSYNALGRSAAEVLGAALINNNTLKRLNIANNGIDPIGCFCLFVGIRENKSLEFINVDGNPIGVLGGRILIKVAASDGHRLEMTAKNCDVTIKSPGAFNMHEPQGKYEFDLSNSYDRSCLLELLDICAANPSIEFGMFEFGESKSTCRPLKITKYVETVKLNINEQKECEALKELKKIRDIPFKTLMKVVKSYDRQNNDHIQTSSFKKIMKDLKINVDEDFLSDLRFALDTHCSGVLNVGDFVEYLLQRGVMAAERFEDMYRKVRCSTASEPNTRYVPPTSGFVKCRIVDGFNVGGIFHVIPINRTKVQQVIQAANVTSNPLCLLEFSLDSATVYLEQAKQYYDEIALKTEDAVAALTQILLHMHCADDAMKLIKSVVGHDVIRIRRLKSLLGNAYFPVIGVYSGFYSLDLSLLPDRVCLKKLIERSIINENVRRGTKKWDTSQNGNWNCFRNECHYLPHSPPDICLCPKYYYPIPHTGRVEFDFINTLRPDPVTCLPVHDDRIIDILLVSRLLNEDCQEPALSRLAEFSIGCRKSFIPNGSPYWKVELGRAMQVGDLQYSMYCGLSARKGSEIRAKQREVIKVEKVTAKSTGASAGGGKKGNAGKAPLPRAKNHVDQADVHLSKSRELITKFRSVVYQATAQLGVSPWRKRLYEVMFESKGATDEYKSNALLEYFESELPTLWLYCKHLALILEFFKVGSVQRSCVGSYRVQLVIMLFDRILDLHNFELVLMVLNAEEHAAILARIGILNIFNPCKPEGGWQLDLSRWDERQVAKIMIHLSVVEPGENWLNKTFIFDHGFNVIPGWDLNVTWFTEEGLPKKGILAFEFFAGDGMNLLGCQVDKVLRYKLTSLVLVDQRDLQREIDTDYCGMLSLEHSGSVVKKKSSMAEVAATMAGASATGAVSSTSSGSTSGGGGGGHGSTKNHTTTASTKGHGAATTAGTTAVPPHTFSEPPTLPRAKLSTQSEIFTHLSRNTEPVQTSSHHHGRMLVPYTVEDANAHLSTTDVKWNYTSTIQKTELWQVKEYY